MEKKELGFVLFDGNTTVGKSIEKYSIGVMTTIEPNLVKYSKKRRSKIKWRRIRGS
jgi:hypothetical protein